LWSCSSPARSCIFCCKRAPWSCSSSEHTIVTSTTVWRKRAHGCWSQLVASMYTTEPCTAAACNDTKQGRISRNLLGRYWLKRLHSLQQLLRISRRVVPARSKVSQRLCATVCVHVCMCVCVCVFVCRCVSVCVCVSLSLCLSVSLSLRLSVNVSMSVCLSVCS
jgi:hypothetical protein